MTDESILVVDDQPLSIKLMKLILEGEGYHVLIAANATEAIQVVQEFKPDLILMDIHLPSLDGLALTKLLRSDEESRHIKIVAMSAYAWAEDDQQIAVAGCAGFIPKPINTKTFAASIREYLDK